MKKYFGMIVLFAWASCDARTETPNPPLPKPISKEVAEAWEKAFVTTYWATLSGQTGKEVFGRRFEYDVRVKQPKAGWLPLLYVSGTTWVPHKLAKLPEPDVPFAMYFLDVRLTPETFATLAKFKNLVGIEIHGSSRFNSECVRELKPSSSLRYLGLDNATLLADRTLEAITTLTQLTALKARDSIALTDAGFASLGKLEKLTSLDVSSTEIGVRGLTQISTLTNLSYLNVSQTRYTDAAGLKLIAKLPKLTELSLAGMKNKLTDEAAKELGKIQTVKRLDVTFTELTDARFAELTNLTQLEWLDASINEELTSLKGIKKLDHLRFLNVSSTSVTDAGIRELSELKKLDQLDLGRTHVSDAGLKIVAKIPSLSFLSIAYMRGEVTDEGIQELAPLAKLEKLHVNLNGITAQGVADLQKKLPKCKIDNSK